MVDFLIQMTAGNLLVAAILALIAWLVQTRVRSASLANLLWALVLIKLITPPLFTIPVLEFPSIASFSADSSHLTLVSPPDDWQVNDLVATAFEHSVALPLAEHSAPYVAGTSESHSTDSITKTLYTALAIWVIGSLILLFVSVIRIIRFHYTLKHNSHVDPKLSTELSRKVAAEFGVNNHPEVLLTSANIAPFVWWMSGRVIIVLSESVVSDLEKSDLRFVVRHEMAHIKRRDHWFRWLEWISLVAFWWNPLTWWARKQLRVSEEMACDDLVLKSSESSVHQYASSLLNMAELLAEPVVRPPVVASAINSGGSLENRLKVMIAEKKWQMPTALRTGIVTAAICIFPLGVIVAQDFEAIERRLGGAVEEGEISLEQANLMLGALRESAEMEAMELKERYMHLVEEVKMAIEKGDLPEEEAEHKLAEIKREMFERDHDWRLRHGHHHEHGEHEEEHEHDDHEHSGHDHEQLEHEARERRFHEMEREIDLAVENGHISPAEAELKLKAIHENVWRHDAELHEEDHEHHRHDHHLQDRERRLHEMNMKIERALKEGQISEKEAELKMKKLHENIFRHDVELIEEHHGHEHDQLLKEREQRLHEIEREKVARAQQLATMFAQSRQLHEQSADQERAIEELELRLKAREQRINELEELHQRIHNEKLERQSDVNREAREVEARAILLRELETRVKEGDARLRQTESELEKQLEKNNELKARLREQEASLNRKLESDRNIEMKKSLSRQHEKVMQLTNELFENTLHIDDLPKVILDVARSRREKLKALETASKNAELVRKKLGPGHPAYEEAKAQADVIKQQLNAIKHKTGVVQEGLPLERKVRQ